MSGSPSSWVGAPDRSSRLDGVGGLGIGVADTASSVAGNSDGNRKRNLAVAGVGAVLLLLVGWLVLGRGGDGTDLAADDSIPAVTEAADSLPQVDETADTEPDGAGDEGDDGAGGSGNGSSNGSSGDDDAPEWREDSIELPQVLLDTADPFEIVAMTGTGDFIDVDVPSGRVDALEIGAGNDGRVIAGATTTLFTPYSSGRGGRLIRVGEPPLELSLPPNLNVSRVGIDGDEFAGTSYGNSGGMSLVLITADGGVATTDGDEFQFNFSSQSFAPDGSRLTSEAGGVYVDGDDGVERISTGILISSSTNHLLVRECDEVMVCGYSTIDFATRERVEAVLPDDSLGAFGFDSAQVSPDGKWLRYVSYEDNGSREVLVDLATGERTELDFSNIGFDYRVWAADSSGFFRNSFGEGFEFFDISSGEVVAFGEELGRIASFDIRTSAGQSAPALRTPTTTGLSLIAMTSTGDVAQIDVDSGAVITTDGPGIESDAPVTVFPDAAGATFTFFDKASSVRFVASERSALEIEGPSPGGFLWPGPEAGTVWQSGEGNVVALELVDAQGTAFGPGIEFDAVDGDEVVGSDGRGGVLVELALGGVFAIDASNEPSRVTTGELLAINATAAYVRECDDALQCGVFVVDRVSGARTVVDNTGFDRAGDINSRSVPAGQNVSPDDTIAFVRDANDPTRCLMIDTTASRSAWTGVPCAAPYGPILWTPDSGYAVWLSEGAITIYDRSSRSVRILNTVELSAIAAVPNPETAPPAEIIEPVEPVVVPAVEPDA